MAKNVAVIGAGIMGRTLAWMLIQNRFSVTLFESQSLGTANIPSMVAAGMICPFSEGEHASLEVVAKGLRTLDWWPTILRTLPEIPFSDFSGTVVLTHPQDEALADDFLRRALARQPPRSGISVRRLDLSEAQEILGMELRNFRGGWHVPMEGAVDSRGVMEGLLRYIALHGVVRESTSVHAIKGSSIISAKFGQERFDHVFDCRGLWARQEMPSLRGVRGEILRIHAPEVKLGAMVRLLHPRHSLYIVPRPQGRFVVGATSFESEDTGGVRVLSVLEMLSALYSIDERFGAARLEECASQLRPALPDHNPLVLREAGLTRINGLYRHGYLLAPALAGQVVSEYGEG